MTATIAAMGVADTHFHGAGPRLLVSLWWVMTVVLVVSRVVGMRRLLLVGAGMSVGLVVAASASAAQPPGPLLKAELRTAHATSAHMAMLTSMTVAGKRLSFAASGVERLKAHQASMVVDMSKLSPTIGKMQMIAIGSRYYVHYALLDTLHATRPQVKPWIVVNSVSAAGFDPWSLAGVHSSLGAASGYQRLGTSGGTTRYRVEINLRAAIASNPQMKALLARAGATASGLLDKPIPVVMYVGSDGYLHRTVERITMPVAGQSLTMTIDFRASDFNQDPGPIVAPPTDQVMTLAQFKKLANP